MQFGSRYANAICLHALILLIYTRRYVCHNTCASSRMICLLACLPACPPAKVAIGLINFNVTYLLSSSEHAADATIAVQYPRPWRVEPINQQPTEIAAPRSRSNSSSATTTAAAFALAAAQHRRNQQQQLQQADICEEQNAPAPAAPLSLA